MATLLKEVQVYEMRSVDVPEGPRMAFVVGVSAGYPDGTVMDERCVTHGQWIAAHDEYNECFW